MKVTLISLGCPKNLVDSEEMLGSLALAGYEIVPDPAGADVVVVNTCGFIKSAKEESIEAVMSAVHLKAGGCKAVVVAGCLAQRYADDLAKAIPEVDVFVGVGRNAELPEIIGRALSGSKVVECGEPGREWAKNGSRIRSTAPWTAYLKIADGCDNRCAYCAIPDIRGGFRSRPPELILAEAEKMAAEGVLEVNLIAQDITRYGEGLGGWDLERLVRELAAIDNMRWIRLLYCYPTRITDGLIELVAAEPKVVKYMDIPFQHGDDRVLSLMNRRGSRKEYVDLVRRIRGACPEVALRTSLIVGFPGEGEEEFENLLSFVEEIDFDRVGAFQYSREDGTPAASMPKRVPKKVAARRYDRLMRLAQRISLDHNRKLLGREIEVLVESPECGRSYRDAPDIDGVVKLTGGSFQLGEIVRATVVDADEYDLVAST